VKRPRGRPRKPKNNTADTAIVLSDSDSEEDDTTPRKALWDRKRPLGKVDSPAPAPSPKRPAPSSAFADSSAVRAEVDQLKQELASEKKLRSDAEAENSKLQQLMEEKEAAWAAELAVQMAPFQLQIQKLVQEKQALEAASNDLQQQLQAALGKSQDAPAASKGRSAAAPISEDLAAQIREKEAAIASQAAEIEELSEIEETRAKEVAEAHQKIALLTRTVKELTAQHEASTKAPHEEEEMMQQLQRDLSKSEMLRFQAEEKLVATVRKLEQVEDNLAKSEEQRAKLKEQLARDGGTVPAQSLNIKNEQPITSHQMENEVKGLCMENTRLRAEITALQKKQLLAAVYDDNSDLLKELHGYKEAVDALRAEKEQLLSSLASADATMARLNQELEDQIATSKQKIDSIQEQSEHEWECREQQLNESIAQLRLDLAAKDTEIQQLRERVASPQNPVNTNNLDRAELEKEIAAQSRLLLKLQDASKEYRTRLETKSEAAIEALRQRVNILSAEVKKSESVSAVHQADLQRRGALLAGSEKVISAKKTHIKELQEWLSILIPSEESKPKLTDDIAVQKIKLRELTTSILPELTTAILKSKPATQAQTRTINSLEAEVASISRGRDYIAQEMAARLATVKRLKAHLAKSSAAIDRISAQSAPLDKTLSDLLAEKDKTTTLMTALETEFKSLRSKSAAAVAAINSAILDLPQRLDRLAAENAEFEKAGERQGVEVERLRGELVGVVALVEELEVAVNGGKGEVKEGKDKDKDKDKEKDNFIQEKVKGLFPAWMKK
ncbi:hypothetical protein C8A03DRAFT_18234, partial [Achaetomium macrosporum]